MKGVVLLHLLHGLGDGVQNESMGGFASVLCGSAATRALRSSSIRMVVVDMLQSPC